MAPNIEVERKRCLDILQLDNNAKIDDIKKSYKKLALQCHPDKNLEDPKAKEKFQELSDAYYKLLRFDKRDNAGVCFECGCEGCYDCEDSDWSDESDDDETDGDMWFFRRLFIDVFSEFIFKQRFKYRGQNKKCFNTEEREEDSFFDFIYKKYRSEGWDDDDEFELTEEDLKKFHYYEDWHKAKNSKRRGNHTVRKAKKKAKKLPERPKEPTKKELQAEQKRREKEMQQIGEKLKQKYHIENSNEQDKMKHNKSNHRKKADDVFDVKKELERQQAEKRKREEELEKLMNKHELSEKSKEKKSQKKKSKLMKKLAKNEAIKDLHISEIPSEAFKEYPVNVQTKYEDYQPTDNRKRRKVVSDIDQVSRERELKIFLEKSKKGKEMTSESKSNEHILKGVCSEQKDPPVSETMPRPAEKDSVRQTYLLDKHLNLFHDLMKVQPKRHTQEQIREEKKKELEGLIEKQRHELEEERLSSQQIHSQHIKCEKSGKGTEHYENTRKEYLRKQRELERKRNEEELEEIKTSYIVNKTKKIEPHKEKFLPKQNTNAAVFKPVSLPQKTSNVWADRIQVQKKVDELAPKSVTDEDAMIKFALEMSQKSAESDEKRRRWIQSMRNQNCNNVSDEIEGCKVVGSDSKMLQQMSKNSYSQSVMGNTYTSLSKKPGTQNQSSRPANAKPADDKRGSKVLSGQEQILKSRPEKSNTQARPVSETVPKSTRIEKSNNGTTRNKIHTPNTAKQGNNLKSEQTCTKSKDSQKLPEKNSDHKTLYHFTASKTDKNLTETPSNDSFSNCVWDSLMEGDSVMQKLDCKINPPALFNIRPQSSIGNGSSSDNDKSGAVLQKKFNRAINNLQKGVRSDKPVPSFSINRDVEENLVIEDWDGDMQQSTKKSGIEGWNGNMGQSVENWHPAIEEYVVGTTKQPQAQKRCEPQSHAKVSIKKNNLVQSSRHELPKQLPVSTNSQSVINQSRECWDNDLDSTIDMKRKSELMMGSNSSSSGIDCSVSQRLSALSIKQTNSHKSSHNVPSISSGGNSISATNKSADSWENELDSTMDMKRKSELGGVPKVSVSEKKSTVSKDMSSFGAKLTNSSQSSSVIPSRPIDLSNVKSQTDSLSLSRETWENELDTTLEMKKRSELMKQHTTGGFVSGDSEECKTKTSTLKSIPLDNLFRIPQYATAERGQCDEKLTTSDSIVKTAVINPSNILGDRKQTDGVSDSKEGSSAADVPLPSTQSDAKKKIDDSSNLLQSYYKCLNEMNLATMANMFPFNMTPGTMPYIGGPSGCSKNSLTGMPMLPQTGSQMSQVSPVFAYSMQQQLLKQQLTASSNQQSVSGDLKTANKNILLNSQINPSVQTSVGLKQDKDGNSLIQSATDSSKPRTENTLNKRNRAVPKNSKFAKFVVPASAPVKRPSSSKQVITDSLKQSQSEAEERVKDMYYKMRLQSKEIHQNPPEENVDQRTA